MSSKPVSPAYLAGRVVAFTAAVALLAGAPCGGNDPELTARAVLPAETWASGPTSGEFLGNAPINGVLPPFVDRQPVQGVSAVLDNGDGTFLALADNGFGNIENSADFRLRAYHIRPDFETKQGGTGTIAVLDHIELRDPDRRIPFAIVNHFTADRVLTGADFDLESFRRAADGTLWFGDEFGPFLLHTDAAGRVLEAPIPLPDFDNAGRELRSPQSPRSEESTALRIMNAVRTHARMHGNRKSPVFSPWHVMIDDNNATTFIDNRQAPPAGSGLGPASSDIFNVGLMKSAGYPVVTWTVNDKPRMLELMRLGVNGIISDRPDLLRQAVQEFDANGDGVPGDFIGADGLIDQAKFDAQGHRGGRDLRPENTLPAMEVALDNLMSTLEMDCGLTGDGIPVLDHDPLIQSEKARRSDGTPYGPAGEVLVKDLTLAQIQTLFIADKVFRGPQQLNDPALSPVTGSFAAATGLPHVYAMPSLQQVFNFVKFYETYYKTGAGSGHADAARRWRNASRVRFNIETKINPRAIFAARTTDADTLARGVANVIVANLMWERADIQSFDFRTLLRVHVEYSAIRTVFLFGDFPIFDDPTIAGSDDGTNLQTENGANTPWLAGLLWPYRSTRMSNPFRVPRSGGFEGMALSADGSKLLPLLEAPLVGGTVRTLLIHEFNLATRTYTGVRYQYVLEERGTNIGDFTIFAPNYGLVIEREGSQGDLNGFKTIYQVELGAPGSAVGKTLVADLLRIKDTHGISLPAVQGDVGLGQTFAFPFTTIESVVIFDDRNIGVLNDNNFPFSVGRHVRTGRPDDTEFIKLKLPKALGASGKNQ